MKPKPIDAAFLGGLAFYLLFLREDPGINVTLWFLFLLGLTHLAQPGWLLASRGRWAALALLVALLEFLLVDSRLAFTAVLAGGALVVGSVAHPHDFSPVRWALAALRRQVLTAPVWFFRALPEALAQLPGGRTVFRVAVLFVVPLAVTGLLLLLLSGANPLFGDQVGAIAERLLGWLPDFEGLIIFGIMVGFGTAVTAAWVATEPARPPRPALAAPCTPEHELTQVHRMGLITLALVNALLLLYNIGDIHWIWLNFYLPKGMPLSQLVHEGTYFLIASILLAIGCLFTLFQPRYAALKGQRWLVAGALLWLVQNGVLVASVVVRNARYISEHGLAYKRIGVLFFLALALSGLLTLAYFIHRRQTVGYLLRVNGIVATLLWLGAAAVDWDGLILRHNLGKLQPGHFDSGFHFALSDHQMPLLLEHESRIEPSTDLKAASPLTHRVDYFIQDYEKVTWLSWSPRRTATYRALRAYRAAYPERFAEPSPQRYD